MRGGKKEQDGSTKCEATEIRAGPAGMPAMTGRSSQTRGAAGLASGKGRRSASRAAQARQPARRAATAACAGLPPIGGAPGPLPAEQVLGLKVRDVPVRLALLRRLAQLPLRLVCSRAGEGAAGAQGRQSEGEGGSAVRSVHTATGCRLQGREAGPWSGLAAPGLSAHSRSDCSAAAPWPVGRAGSSGGAAGRRPPHLPS